MRMRSCGMCGLVLSFLSLSGCALLETSEASRMSDGADPSALQQTADRPDPGVPAPASFIASDHEPISNPGADVIRSVQAALNERGFPVGRPDGRIGAQTVRGVRLFKVARRMPVSDAITPGLLSELAIQQR